MNDQNETFDISVLREMFRSEAYELIGELENALLALEEAPQDKNVINRVFRALHTVKGSGGACGFGALGVGVHLPGASVTAPPPAVPPPSLPPVKPPAAAKAADTLPTNTKAA